jgi:hypothetical protein
MFWHGLSFEYVLAMTHGIVKTTGLTTGPERRVKKFTWIGDTINLNILRQMMKVTPTDA